MWSHSRKWCCSWLRLSSLGCRLWGQGRDSHAIIGSIWHSGCIHLGKRKRGPSNDHTAQCHYSRTLDHKDTRQEHLSRHKCHALDNLPCHPAQHTYFAWHRRHQRLLQSHQRTHCSLSPYTTRGKCTRHGLRRSRQRLARNIGIRRCRARTRLAPVAGSSFLRILGRSRCRARGGSMGTWARPLCPRRF